MPAFPPQPLIWAAAQNARKNEELAVFPPPEKLPLSTSIVESGTTTVPRARQLAQLVDTLAGSIAQMRADSRREVQTLRDHLIHERDEHRRELVASEGRLVELRGVHEARLNDLRHQIDNIRGERDQLHHRVRELELARDDMVGDMLTKRKQRGWIGRILAR